MALASEAVHRATGRLAVQVQGVLSLVVTVGVCPGPRESSRGLFPLSGASGYTHGNPEGVVVSKKKPAGEKPHEFTISLPEFDRAMRQIATVTKEEIERREREHKLPPTK